MTSPLPIELFRKGQEDTEPVAYACGACGIVYETRQQTVSCCCQPSPCIICGTVTPRSRVCVECLAARRAREAAELEAAAVLSFSEWSATCSPREMLTDGETYWPYWPDDEEGPLWATVFRAVHLGGRFVDDLIENATQEHDENIADRIDPEALVAAAKAWNLAHAKVGSWYQDDTRRVSAPWEPTDVGEGAPS